VADDIEEVSLVLVEDNEYVSMYVPVPKSRPISNHNFQTFKSLVVTHTHTLMKVMFSVLLVYCYT